MSSSKRHAFRLLSYRAQEVRLARHSIQCAVNPLRKDLERDYGEALVRFGKELMRVRMMEACIKASGEWV